MFCLQWALRAHSSSHTLPDSLSSWFSAKKPRSCWKMQIYVRSKLEIKASSWKTQMWPENTDFGWRKLQIWLENTEDCAEKCRPVVKIALSSTSTWKNKNWDVKSFRERGSNRCYSTLRRNATRGGGHPPWWAAAKVALTATIDIIDEMYWLISIRVNIADRRDVVGYEFNKFKCWIMSLTNMMIMFVKFQIN